MPEKGQRVLRGGNIHYEISDRVRAVDCGGLQLLVKQLELAETIDQRVKVLERHLPYRESDHVLNLIYNVMTGGSCLQDVEARAGTRCIWTRWGPARCRRRPRRGTSCGASTGIRSGI